MKFEIKSHWNGAALFTLETDSIKLCMEAAVKSKANLSGAYLSGAKIDWSSHIQVAEILCRAAGNDSEKRKIAGLVLISTDWCWDKLLAFEDPLTNWALTELRKWVTKDDGAPEILLKKKRRSHEPTKMHSRAGDRLR